MAVIAFGCDRSALKRGGVFLILSMAMGGIALSIGRNDFPALILAALLCYGLCRIAFGRRIGGRTYTPVTLTYGGRTLSLTALEDSGNTLTDPITGEQVLVISGAAAQELTGLTRQQLASPLETLAKRPLPGLRLIPYHAVGCSGGLLLGLRFANVVIGGQTTSAIVAFAPEGLGNGEMYQALTGGVL